MKQLSLLLLFVFGFLNTEGQFYESGQDPASIRWKQINTPNFQVIFPSGTDSVANKLANSLDYLYTHVAKSLHKEPKKISVILHPYSVTSNGFVTLAPRRMELYTTPAQDMYGQDWVDQLAIHELRHVVQIDKLNQGLTHILGILFGQQATGAVAGLIPRWFYEGDAVYTETTLSNSGRGRMGSFTMEMKALLTDNSKNYSFEKMVLGSYKNYIPNQYNFGYTMVMYNRYLYGDSLYSNMLNFTARNPYFPFAFNKSMLSQTTLSDKKIYQQTVQGLKQFWGKTDTSTEKIPVNSTIEKHPATYTSYRQPVFINDTTLFAIKSGIDQRRQFILLYRSRKEKVIYTPGIFNDEKVSVQHNKIAWSEEIPDIRWSNKSTSRIYVKDIETGVLKKYKTNTRYFAPALSPDLRKIAVVNITLNNQVSLALLDFETGNIQAAIPSPGNVQIKYPVWSSDGNAVIVILSGKKGEALYKYNVISMQWEEIVPWSHQNISLPVVSGNSIYYSSDISGTNCIYNFNTETNKTSTIVTSTIGVFDPYFIEKDTVLLYSEYTSRGFSLRFKKISPNLFHPISEIPATHNPFLQKNATRENFNFQDSIVPHKQYETKRYSKLGHIINIHSWTPFYADYTNLQFESQSVYPGFVLLSQDKLSTCTGSVGVAFEGDRPVYHTQFTYKGWFPVINFSMEYGSEFRYTVVNSLNQQLTINKNRAITNTNIYIPLNLSRGNVINTIIPHFNWKFDSREFYDRHTNNFVGNFNTFSFGLNMYSYTRTSFRDLAPRLGVAFYSEYYLKPVNQNVIGSRYYIKSRLYLPGLAKHHSLQLTGGFFSQEAKDYGYSSSIAYPRGYVTGSPTRLMMYTADYAMPLIYPDLYLGRLLYMKRIKTNLFTDWGQMTFRSGTQTPGQYTNKTAELFSTGADITTDTHILRILFPINMGVRMVYLPKLQTFSSYFIFGIDFIY